MASRHRALAFDLGSTTPAAQQIDNDNYKCHDQQQVNQAPANAHAKTQEPENQEYRDKCPKHNFLPCPRFEHAS